MKITDVRWTPAFIGTAVAYRNGTQYANMQLGSHS